MSIFQKLFSGKKNRNTDELTIVPSAQVRRPRLATLQTTGFIVGKKTDIGRQRDKNQDSIYTFESFIEASTGQDTFGIFTVADGMGGYQKGEIASNLAARTAAGYIVRHVYLPYLTESTSAAQMPLTEALKNAVHLANDAVVQQTPEAGTTLTMAVVMGSQAYLAHVGDSRAYLYHDSELQQVTQDHSLVARLVELGQATAEEAHSHPQRNVLYRAIGQTESLEVETYLQPIPPNGYLLLCSDGLWGMIPDEEITRILNAATSPDDAVERLINVANANGGDDNISAILVGIGHQPS